MTSRATVICRARRRRPASPWASSSRSSASGRRSSAGRRAPGSQGVGRASRASALRQSRAASTRPLHLFMSTSLLPIVKTIDMTSDTSVRLTGLVLPALVTAAQFGPFFAWEPWSPDAGWRPWAALCEGDVAYSRVSEARQALIGMFGLAEDAVPMRVVASVTFLGYASRVVSPLLGAAVAGGGLPTPGALGEAGDGPDASGEQVWWRPAR